MAPGLVKVADDDGADLPAGEIGLVWLRAVAATKFDYYGDEEKTAGASEASTSPRRHGLLRRGRVLFLTDRTANLDHFAG